ncbi:hypothetical protein IKG31_01285 [Candidatus Saccharibacteria bacterium]|nr:hypothetical protein [Candidatus Saccharibacteria bacterium]
MKHGKVVKVYLKEGVSNGYAEAELLNWNAKAIRIPRLEVDKRITEDDSLKSAGVYFFAPRR